ncbi:MAG TPA: hypothetical protein VEJ63_07335 [Planctomycetota bacterium]|nr:hypothetical protein [Planctomycetota bacterium]
MAAFDASKDADVKHRATAILRAVRTRGDYLALQISLKDSKAVVALDDSHFMLRDADGLAALRTALDHYVEVRMERKDIELNEHGAIPWPVKLQIDDALIMKDVQRVVMELATRRFVNLQYETNTMKADIPLPPGGTHSEIVVPPEILALAEIGDALPDDEEGRKKILAAVPKLVRIRVHNQATEGAGFEIDGQILNEEKMVGHLKAVKKEKEHGGILLRVSYDENTAFKQVMKVFQAANEAKAKECGLVPIRGEE